jgi:hypothetical protein
MLGMKSRALTILPGLLLVAALLFSAVPARAATVEKIQAAGTLNVEGKCRILTDDQGHQYALVGDLGAFTTGDRISVTGTRGTPSACVEGTTIRVESARPDPERRARALFPALSLEPSAPGFPEAPETRAPLERVHRRSISVRGTLTGEGVECQALRATDGKLYTLTGNLHGLAVGDKVRVVGSVAEVSTCQQGTTLVVEQIRLADAQGDEPEARVKEEEVLTLTGSLTGEGVDCQAFRAEKGELYTLTGDLRSFKTGDRVTLTASPVEGGPCQGQGKTLQVKTIQRAK